MPSNRIAQNDEIDLVELFQGLWSQKWLIIAVTVIVTVLAGCYAFLSKPVYEAKVYLLPPAQSDVADFNYGRIKDSNLVPFAVKDVYGVFLRNLYAESIRRSFYEELYLPSLTEEQQKGSQDRLYAAFSKVLMVAQAGKESPDRYSITVQYEDPVKAAQWVKLYMDRAGSAAKQEMLDGVSREADVVARNINQQINTLREGGERMRNDRVARLREALNVAQAIGLQKPPIITSNQSSELSADMDGSLTYMRGSNALLAEVKNLEQRKSDDPFIDGLRDLQLKYSFYNNLSVNPEKVAVYRQDGSIEEPDSPIKPKKALILLLGIILGGVLGCILALGRHFYLHSRSNG